jgi:hypothetical protein
MCLRDFDWITNLCYFPDKNFNRKSHVGVSIGKFFNFNFFLQLLSDKIFLGKEKN